MIQEVETLPEVHTITTYRDQVNAKRASFIAMVNEGGFKQVCGKWEDEEEGSVCFLSLAGIHASQR